jgi:acetyl esterase/lipase
MKKLTLAVTSAIAFVGAGLVAVDAQAKKAPPPTAPTTSPVGPARADADMQQVLDALDALGPKPLESLTAEEARKQPTPADAANAVLAKQQSAKPEPEKVAKVEDRKIDGPDGNSIPVRIYTPAGPGPFPVIVYYHGGGWVLADLDTYDATPRALANAAGAIVVSADYRKAPEHKFPAAHEDAFAAYQWAVGNAVSLNGQPRQIAVAGESAGGNLAINVAIRARDSHIQTPVHMLLVYPVAGKDMNTKSYVANATARPLGKAGMEWFVKQIFQNPAQAADPRIDLVSRTDLAGLPSATVITAEIDPLRSEGQLLATKLQAAGVKVDAVDYKGVTHEFFGMGAAVGKAKQAQQRAGKDLRAAFAAVDKLRSAQLRPTPQWDADNTMQAHPASMRMPRDTAPPGPVERSNEPQVVPPPPRALR